MRRTLALLALVAGLLTIGASPAGAITGNYQDDSVHSYVALIAFYDANDVFTHRCSGSLITPSVFLTAGHCTDASTGATHARLWFQQDAGVGFDAVTGTPAPSGYPVSSDVSSDHLYNFASTTSTASRTPKTSGSSSSTSRSQQRTRPRS